jgi:hypothetical protein
MKNYYACSDLENENERKTEAEFFMLGLVMPDFHAEHGTDAASRKGDADKTGFRNTPFVVTRFPFVDAI